MKVLFSMYSPTAYGAGKVVAQYASALVEAGHDVGLVYDTPVEALGSTHQSIVPELGASRVHAWAEPGFTNWKTMVVPAAPDSIRHFGADVIVATQLRDAPAVSRIANRLHTPFVMLVQNPPRFKGNAVVAEIKRRVYLSAVSRVELGVCVSEEIEQELSAASGARLATVLNAIDPGPEPAQRRRSELRASFGVQPDDLLMINVARIDPQKGLPDLFDAVALLPTSGRRFKLILVGSARDDQRALEEDLQRRAAEMNGSVEMTGFRTDVRDLLEASDLFVLASLFEGGPSLAALEAMAAGLPAVLSDHGARLQDFEDGVHGNYFPVSDSPALAGLLTQYIELADEERTARGRKAREYVVEHRSLSTARSQFVAHIEAVLGRPVG